MPFLSLTSCAALLACLAPHPAATAFTLSLQDTSGRTDVAVLTCDPDGGTHPHPDAACDTLRSAGGDFGRLPTRRQMCTLLYSPVEVTASGAWHGRSVRFHTRYPSRCAADSRSSGVFGF